MSLGKLRVRAGFVLLLSVLVYLDQGYFLWLVFAAALIHEMGHYIPLRLSGGRIAVVELTGGGVVIERDRRRPMGYGAELTAVLAGPVFSVAFALLFSFMDDIIPQQAALAGMNLSHGLFNLLPMKGLDGGRALSLILEGAECKYARTVLRVSTAICAVALGALCGVLALTHYNLSLLLAMIYLMSSIFEE